MYRLIKYDKFQKESRLVGEIILEQDENANGFFEKITKIGFNNHCFEIQYIVDGTLYGVKIGEFAKDENEKDLNKQIADSARLLLPLLELIKK